MSKLLFEENSASDEEVDFGTNKEYAKHYNKYRQKELLKKCKCERMLHAIASLNLCVLFMRFKFYSCLAQ